MKRILSMLLVLSMVLGMALPVCAAETVDSGTCGENLTWTLDDEGTLTISGTGEMEGFPSWGSYDEDIKSVVINAGATSVCLQQFIQRNNSGQRNSHWRECFLWLQQFEQCFNSRWRNLHWRMCIL